MSPASTASISTASPGRQINLPARLLVPAPPGVDAIGAAVAPVTFGTVEHMLFDNAKLQPGETILVQAGGSGIGTAAIQLAKKIGCTVITTVGSDDKIEKAKALGADHVINYREDRFEGVVRKLTKKKGVDVVFEHVGADTWAGSMLCLKRGGRLVTCGSTSGVSTEINLMHALPAAAAADRLLRLPHGEHGRRHAEDGARASSHPVIDTEVGFDDIDAALAAHGRPRRLRQDHPARELTKPVHAPIPRMTSAGMRAEARQRLLAGRAARLLSCSARCGCCRPTRRIEFRRPGRPHASGRCSAATRVALDNLRHAFPEKSRSGVAERSRSTCGATWPGSAPNMSSRQAVRLRSRTASETGRIEVDGDEIFSRSARRKRSRASSSPPILGNFELLPICAATFGLNVTALFRPPNNPYIAKKLLAARRTDHGPPGPVQGRRRLVALPGVLKTAAMSACWSTRNSSSGVRDEPSSAGRARPIRCCRSSPGSSTGRCLSGPLHPPAEWALPAGAGTKRSNCRATNEGEIDIAASTQMLNDIVEGWVREYPDQWMWFHKRWKRLPK